MRPSLRKAWYFVAVVLITASISVGLTIVIMNAQHGDRVILDHDAYQSFQALLPLMELMENIQNEHFGEEITDEELIDGALKGMLSSLNDPYAQYYSEEEYIAYLEQLDGSYHGIGALIGQPQQDEASGTWGTRILKVYENSPAEQAGLLSGDLVTALDGEPIGMHSLEDIERLFSGDDGSILQVDVLRGAELLSFSVKRAKGTTQRVIHKLFQQRTGYVTIDKFTGSATEEFAEAMRDLTDRGMRSLVIDLRNNPGGELKQVVDIANQLVSDCRIVVVRAANGEETEYRADMRSISVPLAILVNENSASASEILAAAVQDAGRGMIVGCNTYGKGVVQTTMQLRSNQGWAKFTTAAYYSPNGHHVDGQGIAPDIDIDLSKELKALPIDQIDQEDDAQLWAALDIVREQADALEAGKMANAPTDLEETA